MSDAYAKAAVEEEMGRRYAANPWDGDGPAWSSRRKRMRMRTEGLGEVERGEGKKRGEVKGEGEARYSEREWDDFERSLGYL